MCFLCGASVPTPYASHQEHKTNLRKDISMKYTKDNLWEFGTKVKAVKGSSFESWNRYPITVIAFRWRDDGGIDYRVRAWRTNQHWVHAEDLEKVADAEFCSNCMKVMRCYHSECLCD